MKETHRNEKNTLGKSYQIALACLENYRHRLNDKRIRTEENEHIFIALDFFSRVVQPLRNRTDINILPQILANLFDLDNIIDFSHAWSVWENLPNIIESGECPTRPLDQQFFNGRHEGAIGYFQGIEELAKTNVMEVCNNIRIYIKEPRLKRMMDLGAGPAVYSKEFIKNGLVEKSQCFDLPYVHGLYKFMSCDGISWTPADIIEHNFKNEGTYDLVYIGNVFHHFNKDCIKNTLRNISSSVSRDGYLIIQDYMLWSKPSLPNFYAAAFGLHFSLTTAGSRCYTNEEFYSWVSECIPGLRFYHLVNLGHLDLMIFKNDFSKKP